MVLTNKKMLVEKLTGIHSSKKSYYVELKKKIEETYRRNLQLEIINQLAKSIGIEMSFNEMLEKVIPRLQTLVEFSLLSFYIIEENIPRERFVFLLNNDSIPEENNKAKKYFRTKVNPDHSALLQVVEKKQPFLCNDLSTAKINEILGDIRLLPKNIKAVIMIPLLSKGQVRGVLELAGEEEYSEKEDLSFLQQVADQLAVCFENARLYHEIWKSKQEWEITFSAVRDLLIFITPDYKIQRVNKAAVKYFNLTEKELLGQKCYRLFYGRESKCKLCLLDQVLETKKTAYLQTRTQYNRVLDIFAYPAYTEEEKPYGITYYAKDVTRFVDSIKFVSLGEMAAGVAHELNSPLTAIVGNSQLLLRETDPQEPHYQLIKGIKESGMRCQGIIRNLLTFSRQDEFTFENIDLNQVVENALALLSYQIEKSRIVLLKSLAPSMPLILGNSQGLEQVIINLLLNAKDAVEEKERKGKLTGKGEVQINTRFEPGKFVAVDIIDNGCGIEPEKIPNLFNPFFTTKKVGRGTGLGLSVSLGIVQAHGGFINVDSVLDQGSTFSLIIPLDAVEGEAGDAQQGED